jgi:hypothetical protein
MAPMYPGQPRRGNYFLFFIYVIFGAYFINYAFDFIKLPSVIVSMNKWIIFVGGVLIIIGSFNLLKSKRYPY